MIEVVTVWAPRRGYAARWPEYRPLVMLQKWSAEKFGHKHVVVTDAGALPGFNTLQADLPESLMKAQVAGQLAYLRQWSGAHPVLLLDADCLVARKLDSAFYGGFDLGLTRREHDTAPVNNGAMYIAAGCKPAVLDFFARALLLCGDHWGGDQEAISQAAAPVPRKEQVERRGDLRLAFFSMKTHNVVPKAPGARHFVDPYVVHFKGERKGWMQEYFEKFVRNR